MASLKDIVDQLHVFPDLYLSVPLQKLNDFIHYARYLKPEIQLNQPFKVFTPPLRLPQYVHEFLRDILALDDLETLQCWMALKSVIWEGRMVGNDLTPAEMAAFQECGMRKGERATEMIAPVIFYPPIHECHQCNGSLSGHSRYPVVFYSEKLGACAAYTSSLLCKTCKIRYHHNYYVQENLRCYYCGPTGIVVPKVIQFEEHAFIEAGLCERFTLQMLFAWVSAQNCANIYNHCPQAYSPPEFWPQTLTLNCEQVWHAFFLYALLRDAAEQNIPLVLPHSGNQDARLQRSLENRNLRILCQGQREKMHACVTCEKFIPGTGYNGLRPFRGVVVDGLTIGRPCCKVHNCTRPLISNRKHFCHKHDETESKKCVISDCHSIVDTGFCTCSLPAHRELELYRKESGQAFFKLQQRLKRFNINQIVNSFGDDADANNEEFEEEAEDTPKLDEGNRKPKARFGRRRTHNEQLVVCCCGIIAARATMYGAEAISGVKDFLKSVYNHNPDNLPDVIFFDNNCRLQEHLQKEKDTFFRRVILAVDVFHFKSKHKETDKFCQRHCNPALWKELVDENNKWVFNSSAAEQANVWLGGYLAMVREMLPHRYDFFLDEMIKRRNEKLVEKLRASGKRPYHIPDACA